MLVDTWFMNSIEDLNAVGVAPEDSQNALQSVLGLDDVGDDGLKNIMLIGMLTKDGEGLWTDLVEYLHITWDPSYSDASTEEASGDEDNNGNEDVGDSQEDIDFLDI